MSVLTYKGYQGAVEYEDRSLIIQLLHIDDFISTSVKNSDEVETAFHDLVDDYLTSCAKAGRPPNKPYKGSLNIRMEPELHRQVAYAATAGGTSLNSWIVSALREKLARGEEQSEWAVHFQPITTQVHAVGEFGFVSSALARQTGVNFVSNVGATKGIVWDVPYGHGFRAFESLSVAGGRLLRETGTLESVGSEL